LSKLKRWKLIKVVEKNREIDVAALRADQQAAAAAAASK
jgi:hypothetical protein